VTRIAAEPLTADAFAPFGRAIDRPAAAPDAEGEGFRWWAETALLEPLERPYAIGWLDLEPPSALFDWAERHMRSPEAVLVTGGECLLYAGPPDYPSEPERLCPLERFRAFRVHAGQGVVLDRGVWHGAPLAVGGRAAALVLLAQGTGVSDLHLVRFPDTPIEIEGQ
jgi:ureidoglycolate lyase